MSATAGLQAARNLPASSGTASCKELGVPKERNNYLTACSPAAAPVTHASQAISWGLPPAACSPIHSDAKQYEPGNCSAPIPLVLVPLQPPVLLLVCALPAAAEVLAVEGAPMTWAWKTSPTASAQLLHPTHTVIQAISCRQPATSR
jgi:hypothetical protein